MKTFPLPIPFVIAQGVELVASGGGQSELRLDLRLDQTNQLGIAHGGVLMTLLDVAMAQAARTKGPEQALATIEMKTTFMQPARGMLTGRGQLIQATGRMAFTEASVYDAQGIRCAHATGTFRYVELKRDPAITAQQVAEKTPTQGNT